MRLSESVKCSLLLETCGSNLYPPWTSVTVLRLESYNIPDLVAGISLECNLGDRTIALDRVF